MKTRTANREPLYHKKGHNVTILIASHRIPVSVAEVLLKVISENLDSFPNLVRDQPDSRTANYGQGFSLDEEQVITMSVAYRKDSPENAVLKSIVQEGSICFPESIHYCCTHL